MYLMAIQREQETCGNMVSRKWWQHLEKINQLESFSFIKPTATYGIAVESMGSLMNVYTKVKLAIYYYYYVTYIALFS